MKHRQDKFEDERIKNKLKEKVERQIFDKVVS
jgi:hypothetical protein